jgi:hypothetical protein
MASRCPAFHQLTLRAILSSLLRNAPGRSLLLLLLLLLLRFQRRCGESRAKSMMTPVFHQPLSSLLKYVPVISSSPSSSPSPSAFPEKKMKMEKEKEVRPSDARGFSTAS